MDAHTIRTTIKELQKTVSESERPFVFQALEKIASRSNGCNRKNIARLIFYICGGFIYKDLIGAVPAVDTNTITFALYDKPRYKDIWDGFLKRHDHYQEGDVVVYINTKQKKLFWLFSNRQERVVAQEIHKNIFTNRTASFFEKLFSYWELSYCLKMRRYHRRFLETSHVGTPKYFLTVGDSVIPGVIYAEYMKEQGAVIDSFQFFNLSEDQEYKVHAESVWSNMTADRYFVWGDTYKSFVTNQVSGVEISVIGHPLYKKTPSSVLIPTEKNIIIAANPPEMRHINQDFFTEVCAFAQKYGYNVYARLHPNDSIDSYAEFTKYPEYKGVWNKGISGVYAVNNSTVYFDLVYEQQVVVRYKHAQSYLTVVENVKDYFQTYTELHDLLKRQTEQGLNNKRDQIITEVLGLE